MTIPPQILKTAELFAPGRTGQDALEWIVEDYPRLVAEIRTLRRRFHQLDDESHALDDRLKRLQEACRAILEL